MVAKIREKNMGSHPNYNVFFIHSIRKIQRKFYVQKIIIILGKA